MKLLRRSAVAVGICAALGTVSVLGANPASASVDGTDGTTGTTGTYICYKVQYITVGGPVPVSVPVIYPTGVTSDPAICPPGSTGVIGVPV